MQTEKIDVKKYLSRIKNNQGVILQTLVALFFVGMGVFFVKNEQAELTHVRESFVSASPFWVSIGLGLVLLFIVVMGLMYRHSFRAIGKDISLATGMILYLKRNLVSVFLPAGVLTNMAFFNKEVEKREGVMKAEIYLASSIYTACSILSTLVIGIPVLIWLAFHNLANQQHYWGVILTGFILIIIAFISWDIYAKGKVYQFIEKRFPAVLSQIQFVRDQSFQRKELYFVLLLSIAIELIGVAHLYISMLAITGTASLGGAITGYSVVLLLLMSSPFLRGIGAIEVACTFLLTTYGFSEAAAISTTFLFRFFEFWIVLVIGVLIFLLRRDNLLLRVFPAFLLFVLGGVNILSSLSPAIPKRLETLQEFVPLSAIDASNYLVLFLGLLLFVTSVFLIKGFRTAWWIATVLSVASLIAHLTKGIDYEEATLALISVISLFLLRKHYFVKSNALIKKTYLLPGIAAISMVLISGTVAFYFLDHEHFGQDFNWLQAFGAMLRSFFLLNDDLHPITKFGGEFLTGVSVLGVGSMGLLVFLIFKPFISPGEGQDELLIEKAKAIIAESGTSNLDYFKTYFDKKWWVSEDEQAAVAFKNTSSYAVVLENPVVLEGKSLLAAIQDFDQFSYDNNLRSVYYRVPQADVAVYEKLGKKILPIGQEATLNLTTFTTEGGHMKAFRNSISRITKSGYTFHADEAPQRDGFLQQLKAVSDAWLIDNERQELGFSQGIFKEDELKNQLILSVQNAEGRVMAFVNIIPSDKTGEANFDLMRKTEDAEGGTMDFLFVNMFLFLKKQNCKSCTLGMVPMSGIEQPENFQERIIKMAYEKINKFANYRSLRFYKEKYKPTWEMKYLVYDAPLDLVFLPAALEKVMKV